MIHMDEITSMLTSMTARWMKTSLLNWMIIMSTSACIDEDILNDDVDDDFIINDGIDIDINYNVIDQAHIKVSIECL